MRQPKEELMRFVRLPSGNLVFDLASRMDGRGYYLCFDIVCIEKAFKSKKSYLHINQEDFEKFKEDIIDKVIFRTINTINLYSKMGYTRTDISNNFNDGDVLIVENENNECKRFVKDKEKIQGTKVFRFNNIFKDIIPETMIIKTSELRNKEIIRNLHFLEGASIRGVTV
jgi:predicted RNA-binding protein YlxR (DUF448 family)